MKKIPSILMLVLFLSNFSNNVSAQNSLFTSYLGNWEGVLQYLDYQTQDTVSIRVTLRISERPESANDVLLEYAYPDEPGHEHKDTLTYAGPFAANPDGRLDWHVAERGKDAGKAAIILRGYLFTNGELRIWKEVQWEGKPGFFLRNQYLLRRVKL